MDILRRIPDHLLQQVQRDIHRRHNAWVHMHGCGLVHAQRPLVHDAKPVFKGIDTGQAQGGQLAQAMARHGHRMDT